MRLKDPVNEGDAGPPGLGDGRAGKPQTWPPIDIRLLRKQRRRSTAAKQQASDCRRFETPIFASRRLRRETVVRMETKDYRSIPIQRLDAENNHKSGIFWLTSLNPASGVMQS